MPDALDIQENVFTEHNEVDTIKLSRAKMKGNNDYDDNLRIKSQFLTTPEAVT